MVDIEKVIAQSEENIRQALQDYARHSTNTDVMDDASDAFIHRLAKDNAYAKRELRELFSKSPVYDSKLDALVINGTRTHDPDPERILTLGRNILCGAIGRQISDTEFFTGDMMWSILYFFSNQWSSEGERDNYIGVINHVAPKAYKVGRKLSRVFKQICQALEVADETAGSEFQRLYAQFADELTAKKIGFKLFVSLNPAHFITMSNPKWDQRGNTLTSCHSFNSTEYSYNSGCTGYARDKWSFIVFTAADPTEPETLNNRKTTRQIFAYMPGNGVLLQSRLYNTSGGTTGAQADSKLYRDLVQREISMLEDAANLWRTFRCVDEDDHVESDYVSTGYGFGGYEDWIYREFNAHISVRSDHDEEGAFEPLKIGTYGLCVVCAEETSNGVYCEDCEGGRYVCEDCHDGFADEDDLYTVYDSRGNSRQVCQSCRDRYYTYCDRCDCYYPNEDVERVDGEYLCPGCREEYCSACEDCGELHLDGELVVFHNARGEEIRVCEDCRAQSYTQCDCCGEYFPDDTVQDIHMADERILTVCPDCLEAKAGEIDRCRECGELYETSALEDGLCPDCAVTTPTSEGEVADDNETEESA